MKNKYIVLGIIILVLVGGGIYFLIKKSPAKQEAESQKALDDIAVSIPEFDFSSSPLPDLNISSLNVAAPKISGSGIFTAPSLGSSFSFTPDTSFDIKMPTTSFNFTVPKNIPSASSDSYSPPAGVPVSDSGSSIPPSGSGSEAPQVECSMFASVPACSYVGSPDSQGYQMCKQCFPNK
jgi:hypothetical protein